MQLEDFHALGEADAQALVRRCADVPSWAAAVVAARPYPSVAALRAHADDAARRWTASDVEQALADHPRIGERHRTPGATAALSAREQAGVDPADARVAARLADGNARYEQRFGRVFLVRAAGRSSAEILALLERRLTHDDATEAAVTAQQLREIAALRLADLVDDPVEAPAPRPAPEPVA
ncbi:2-oxo-4-hydroxy-4-carboxy-5-ureidoimidazoline decarboxylase [Cellulomonas phragmiteti]|uniref:2-oxo-4-hydroxy-4-carboxy-5-ureidoimidazoline decarboxylase n=1 Tax=Cellulomonas phragmiteti TaxID=478780 RepID=A0ABQ4DMD4_9CELL|nr:2-oxo-4-hydroxy-4-carboxy-5-ureidoimidazoline decarboxylase [Cellulomonas phragmiteti]GIG40508.1 OHCU decarboxylase [Cellulomonas phragmiteti]